MNNKRMGTDFEREMCKLLKEDGFWVHFISPDASGAQPFDIIAVKAGHALAIDCKTCVSRVFTMDRLEDNQKNAFSKWLLCGNPEPYIAIKHYGKIYLIGYRYLMFNGKVDLRMQTPWCKRWNND